MPLVPDVKDWWERGKVVGFAELFEALDLG